MGHISGELGEDPGVAEGEMPIGLRLPQCQDGAEAPHHTQLRQRTLSPREEG